VRWVAGGEFARVVEDARAFGEERCLGECPREPLRALAEAARYSGQANLAQHALEALRKRFPNTVDAAEAAFLIGRAAERSGQWIEAVRNYETYLAEAPNGRFAEDAVGGKLQVLAQRGDPAARIAATQYLERFPQGLHAERARQVLSPP
jgi:outer membrane protein assembly factor BamD (BamD/ComL family)